MGPVSGLLDALITVGLSVLLVVGPAVAILVWRDRRKARPVQTSASVVPESVAQGSGQRRSRRPMRNPADEALRQVLIAKAEGDVASLIAALRDPDPGVRSCAARYLAKLGAVEAIPALLMLLNATNFHVRTAGVLALGRLRATEAVPALLEAVDIGPEDVFRAWAIDALGKIRSNEAVPKLIDVLSSPHEGLCRTAAAALGAIGDPSAVPALQAKAQRESWMGRRHYRRALRRIGA